MVDVRRDIFLVRYNLWNVLSQAVNIVLCCTLLNVHDNGMYPIALCLTYAVDECAQLRCAELPQLMNVPIGLH